MINGFEEQTQPLTQYEEFFLLPVIVKGLNMKVGKEMAVTNNHIVSSLKVAGYKITEARIRKLINHIRVNSLVLGLIATSEGYYKATSEEELISYENSLKSREDAIRAVRISIRKQREQMFHNDMIEGKLF